MANLFRYLKRNCPVCSGARDDCREHTHTRLIHCLHDVTSAPGFRFVGQDAIGFNMWAVDDGRGFDEANWDELRHQRGAERERRLQEDAERFAEALDPDERERNIRKIHAQLGLTTRHRQALRDRGLTDERIDAGKFFSIDPWQEVTGINPRLAGVDLYGRKLLIGQSGFACPIADVEGRLICWQTRFDDDTEGGKYKWPTSRSVKRPNGPTAHMPNCELPITCCRPTGQVKRRTIGLVEGFLKPYIAAQNQGQVIIGAAGGNFSSSQKQLKAYLDALSAELNTKKVTLYPDAGAIGNPHVMGRYAEVIEIVQQWGYSVEVAWWGQEAKTDPDIDELPTDVEISYLTPSDFLKRSSGSGKRSDAGVEASFIDRNTITWARFLDGYNLNGDSTWITAIDPLIPEDERCLHGAHSLRIHKETGAIKSLYGSDPTAVCKRMREIAEKGIYRELTQLTLKPWKEINTPKLDLESLGLEPGAIYIVRSAKGTHKTNSLVAITPAFRNVYAWFSRIALGREECHRLGLDWKDDLKSFTGNLKVGFCADSSSTFPPRHLKNNGLLLGDEADQVFEHMFGDTCNKDGKRPLILAALKAQIDTVIAGSGMALFMSADITDKEVEYIKELAPLGCEVRLIVNHHRPVLGDVYFHESTTPDPAIEQLMKDLEEGKNCFVIDDMKTGVRGCKSIAEYIRQVYPELANQIVEINSDTSGDPAIIEYLTNINTISLTTRLLCCSPSVVSGISIENKHFGEVYGFFNGILTVSQASQALARVRGAEVINVWAAEKGRLCCKNRSRRW